MRVTKAQIVNGLADYILEEIIPAMGEDPAMKILFSVAVHAFKANGALLDKYLSMDIIRTLIDDDGSGTYDIQPLADWLRTSIEECGPLPFTVPPVPLVSPREISLRLGPSDIAAILRHIKAAGE